MRKKKVLILGKLPPPYMGPAIGTAIMLRSALNEDFDLFHLDTKANYTLTTLGKWSFYKLFKNIQIYFNLSGIIRNNKPDLVMIPISQTTLGFVKDSVFLIIAASFRRKIILHFLGGEFRQWVEKSSFITRLYVKWIMKLAEGVIVLGNNLKYLFENYYKDDAIFVIPNGANYSIPPAPGERLSEDGTSRIIYVSSLSVNKGIEDVLQAMALLKKEYKNKFSLRIIGSWHSEALKNGVMKWLETQDLPISFSPPGISNEAKLHELSKADIFVFTPRAQEGQPWVILEAMASGLPVISTDRGAIVEMIKDGQNGFIVNRQSPEQIAEKINYLIDHPRARKEMGEKSRQAYLDGYTEDKMVRKLRDCFNKITGC